MVKPMAARKSIYAACTFSFWKAIQQAALDKGLNGGDLVRQVLADWLTEQGYQFDTTEEGRTDEQAIAG